MIFATIFINLVSDIVHARYSAYMLLFSFPLKHDHYMTNFSSTWVLRIHSLCIYRYISSPLFICFTLQVNFCYFEAGENKQALVKLVACERWVSMKHCRFCCPCHHCFLLNPYPLVKWLISIIWWWNWALISYVCITNYGLFKYQSVSSILNFFV